MNPYEQYVPSYIRLEHSLRESITSGRLKPGDPVPPESQLCQQFNISRNTVRQALARLVFEGLIQRERGRGSLVAEPRFQHTNIFPSFEEEMQAKGSTTAVRLLEQRVEPAEGKVAQSLGLPLGAPVFVLERQRIVDGQVVGYEIRYLPERIGRALTEEEIRHRPLVPAVRRILGRLHTRLDLRVTASVVRKREAKILDTKVGTPVLVRENTWYLEPEGPIQYGKSIFRGDRYQMCIGFSSNSHHPVVQ
jgi:GntR family transcriptional regulator